MSLIPGFLRQWMCKKSHKLVITEIFPDDRKVTLRCERCGYKFKQKLNGDENEKAGDLSGSV